MEASSYQRPLPEGPIHPGSGRGIDWRKLFAPVAAAGLLLLKFGAKLKALLFLLPKIKVFTTSASMLVSVAAYSLIWGWKFAVGFVLLIFVHEMGHVLQLRREGLEASAPMFIPFFGAVIWAKSLGDNAAAEARVGLAGPVIGSLASAALIPVASATGNDLFTALAFTGFLLNLFNLLPVLPLDGGRAMAALSPTMWLVGFAALVGLTIAFPNPIMLIILLVGGLETWRRWRERKSPGAAAYYEVSPRDRFLVAATYLGLIALLAFGMTETHLERDFGDA
ncbi:MAG TPA: site-2 protease family protein [Solirubrobacterales bacterium]|nr:site-2 protease family protein [Solirubrobacterales bacterium]